MNPINFLSGWKTVIGSGIAICTGLIMVGEGLIGKDFIQADKITEGIVLIAGGFVGAGIAGKVEGLKGPPS